MQKPSCCRKIVRRSAIARLCETEFSNEDLQIECGTQETVLVPNVPVPTGACGALFGCAAFSFGYVKVWFAPSGLYFRYHLKCSKNIARSNQSCCRRRNNIAKSWCVLELIFFRGRMKNRAVNSDQESFGQGHLGRVPLFSLPAKIKAMKAIVFLPGSEPISLLSLPAGCVMTRQSNAGMVRSVD